YNDSEKKITFPNGSTILFRYLDTESDEGRFQGTEVDVLFIDEATQQPERRWDILRACLRGVNQYPKRIYLTCNPGGIGHEWVKRIFIDRHFKDTEKPEEYTFIQSLVTDNKALMREQPDYLDQLKSLPPKQREAWLYGNWDIFEGQFFEDFRVEPDLILAEAAGCTESKESLMRSRRWTHVIEPFAPDPKWKLYRSFDWGYNRPFSVGWWAVDFDGVVYRILEMYGCTETPNEGVKWIPPTVFKEIARTEREHPWLRGKTIHGIADPAIWNAETGVSIAETAQKHGVYFEKGDHERIPGWMQVHYRLAFDQNGFPMMYVFSTCKAFIRTIPLLQYDEHKPEDLDTTGEDHVADETRYFLMARPIKPRMTAAPSKFKLGPLYQYLDIEEKDMMKAHTPPRMEILSHADDE
ncbi:MAG: phage terminase large subunit, partial [Oscillospiraceae bacterium]|nr:phage terminase large subunit [Oscillospiraceae bacterium]